MSIHSCADCYRARVLDLDQQLELEEFDAGIFWVVGSLDDLDVHRVARKLDHHARLGAESVMIRIASPGGAVYPSLAVYDLIKGCGMRTIGRVSGFAASAAAMIVLQGCTERQMEPTARMLIHEPRRFGFGMETNSSLKDEHAEMDALTKLVAEIMAGRSGHTADEVEALFARRERWMNAAEALEFGLIDRVLA